MGAKPCCTASPTSADAVGSEEPVKHLSTEDDQQSKDNPGPVADPAIVAEEAKLIGLEPKLIQEGATPEEAKLIDPKLVQAIDTEKSGPEAGAEAGAKDRVETSESKDGAAGAEVGVDAAAADAPAEQKEAEDKASEEEAARKLEEETKAAEAEAEVKKQADAEAKKKADVEAKANKKAEAEAKKKADAEAKTKKAEEAALKKKKAEEEEKAKKEAKKQLADAGTHFCAGAESGKMKLMKSLLSLKASPDDQDAKGRRPLQVAIVEKNVNVVKVLLEAKADCNVTGTGLQTGPTYALHVCARDGSPEVCQLLLDAKADPEQKNQRGQTAATIAEGKKNHDFIKVIRAHISKA